MDNLPRSIIAADQPSTSHLLTPLYVQQVIEGDHPHGHAWHWPTPLTVVPAFDGERRRYTDWDGESSVLLGRDGLVAILRVVHGSFYAHAWATRAEQLEALGTELIAEVPRATFDDESQQVPVTFWSMSMNGPSNRTRTLDVLDWTDVVGNYVGATIDELGPLFEPDFQPGAGGQLLVWHGKPGTGKTSALRALAWEWRKWCDLHYVTDPEVFFGDKAAYMLDVLLDESGGPIEGHLAGGEKDGEAERPPIDPRAKDGRWRLLVLEDTGEMLSADARERTGQGLARLLNVVDGLIGQGLRVLVLVTTNEELGRLHAAVSRPGRCAARVAFHEFPQAEANAWLAQADAPPLEGIGAVPLSDLYARVAGRRTEQRARAGFASS